MTKQKYECISMNGQINGGIIGGNFREKLMEDWMIVRIKRQIDNRVDN
jgi:hypothetical protein